MRKYSYRHILLVLSVVLLGINACKEDELPNIKGVSAGADLYDLNTDGYICPMSASALEKGQTGTWSIIRGARGSFDDIHDPKTVFHGEPGQLYTLQWMVQEGGASSSEKVEISFAALDPQIISYVEDTVKTTYVLHLEGATPEHGAEGYWTYEGEGRGFLSDTVTHTPTFQAYPGEEYELTYHMRFGGTNVASNPMRVIFDSLHAYAGDDKLRAITDGSGQGVMTLPAIHQEGTSSLWTIISDNEKPGRVVEPTMGNSLFEGYEGELYTLTWEVKYDGYADIDTVNVSFGGRHTYWTDERDGTEYRTIVIGDSLEWMADNFRYAYDGQNAGPLEYPGTSMYYGATFNQPINNGAGYVVTTPEDKAHYGRIYDYFAADQAAPEGWRLPTEAEWDAMIHFYGGSLVAGDPLEEGGVSGLELTYAGYRDNNGSGFWDMLNAGYYWAQLEGQNPINAKGAPVKRVGASDMGIYSQAFPPTAHISVRYVREVK